MVDAQLLMDDVKFAKEMLNNAEDRRVRHSELCSSVQGDYIVVQYIYNEMFR